MAPENPGPEQHPDEKRGCDLYFVAVVNGQELHTRWLYSTDMFNKSTIKKIGQKYLKELQNIVKSILTGA